MRELSKAYPVWLCDIWGVVHDGHRHFAPAVEALRRHRQSGGTVILVTNAPRRHDSIERQLARLGVSVDSHDDLVTSGDVTRHLIVANGAGGVYHLGPERDAGIFDGLGVARLPLDDAAAVVCTGLFDDLSETPAHYEARLGAMLALDLTMICANPDKIVRSGQRLLFCAGALAERYEQMGGRVLMAGKPYPPIYNLALRHAGEVRGRTPGLSEVLAIGDGPDTDMRGAATMGIDAVLVAGGIADAALSLDAVEAQAKARVPKARIVRTLAELAW